VRDGETVELAARTVTVAAFELLGLRRGAAFVDVDVRVECSSGTYVRALARDLGEHLGTGGHLTALRRTRIGAFDVAEAAALADLDVASALMSPADAASRALPVVHLTGQQAVDLGHGKRVEASGAPVVPPGEPIAAIAPDGRLVAIVERRGDSVKVVTGFPAEEAGA
ncbi:MAG: tRNA pseudouridine synthase, partial [Agromyces sp.]|nr:tRNA pseudouridine synthase [Agromyces sp.]